MFKNFSRLGFFIFLCFGLFSFQLNANSCYINIEDHSACGPSSNNSDLKWKPDPVARQKLFSSPVVQENGDGCEFYGKLIKSECNPDLPVETIFYALNDTIIVRAFIVQRSISLFKSAHIPVEIKNYLYTNIKIPIGNWGDKNFLSSIVLEDNMNLIDYVAMMNRLYSKYPMNDFKTAYIDYITGDFQMIYMNVFIDNEVMQLSRKIIPIIVNTLEE